MLSSYDISAPITNLRKLAMWTRTDPLNFRRDFRYDFELEIFDILETQSVCTVCAPNSDRPLKTGSTFSDYYGFGKSRKEAIEEAQKFAGDFAGANLDISVITTLETRAGFFDDHTEPFYGGTVRCFYVPENWFHDGDPLRTQKDFITWLNGDRGPDADALEAIIAETKDIAGDRRNRRK